MVFKCQQEITISYGFMNLINLYRAIWSELAIWTRTYILGTMSNYGNVAEVGARLYTVPVEIQNQLKTIFGEEAAEKFQILLSQHVVLIMTLADAIKRGDIETQNTIINQLYQNADEMAAYLSEINPFWNITQWTNLLHYYISLTTNDLVALASSDFAQDIQISDRITYHVLLIGEYMANGIIQYLQVIKGIQ